MKKWVKNRSLLVIACSFGALLGILLVLFIAGTFTAVMNTGQDDPYSTVMSIAVDRGDGRVILRIPAKYYELFSEDDPVSFASGENVNPGDTIYIQRVMQTASPPSGTTTSENLLSRYTHVTTLQQLHTQLETADLLVETLQRGESTSLKQTFKVKQKTGILGDYFVNLGLNTSLSVSIKKGTLLAGPDEDSEYSTRQYRIKFYGQSYEWTQERHSAKSGALVSDETGTALVPTTCVEYWIDQE